MVNVNYLNVCYPAVADTGGQLGAVAPRRVETGLAPFFWKFGALFEELNFNISVEEKP